MRISVHRQNSPFSTLNGRRECGLLWWVSVPLECIL